MSTLWIAAAVLAVTPIERPDWRAEVPAALRQEATSAGAENAKAVRDLVDVYRRVSADKKLPSAQRARHRAKLESRLRHVAGRISRSAARGGAAADDHGPELVELIQQTIAPQSWDINGGTGTIVYFRPLRVIVVRQTAEVHDGLGDLLGQFRRAGN